jgi:hypothetical protein
MSDINFNGLEAFLIFLLLLAGLGVILIISVIQLIMGKIKWTCHPSFGYFVGSVVSIMITIILITLTNVGSMSLHQKLDDWAIPISLLLIVGSIVIGFRYAKRLQS